MGGGHISDCEASLCPSSLCLGAAGSSPDFDSDVAAEISSGRVVALYLFS